MSEFRLRPSNMRTVSTEQTQIAAQMSQLEQEILRVRSGLSFEVGSKERIRQRLKTAGDCTGESAGHLRSAAQVLANITDTYEATEQNLAGLPVSKETYLPICDAETVLSILPGLVGIGAGVTITPATPSNPGTVDSVVDAVSRFFQHKDKDHFPTGDVPIADREKNAWQKTFVSQNEKDLGKSQMDPLLVWGGSVEKSGSLLGMEGEALVGDADGTYAQRSYGVLQRDAYAQLYGGLFVMGEDGEKIFAPALGAALGLSLSGLTAAGEARLGSDLLGVKVSGDATLGKLNAEAKGAVSLRDEDGNLDPTLHGEAALEALAFEASGAAVGQILGTEIGVQGSVTVGVGVHAEAGYQDGVFSLEIGAALGVGGSVGLVIDVGGTVDAVCDGAKAAWTEFTSWFD